MRASAAQLQVSGVEVPPELLNPAAEVWHNVGAFVAYMRERGWTLPPQERMGAFSSPANRRSAAAEAWGVDNGITAEHGSHFADWHKLRALGLISE